jgi:hypothetical protein
MSASTSKTRLPCWASAMAKLQLTVDFPSAGNALDVTRTLAGFSGDESRI